MRRRLMMLTCMVAIGAWTAATIAGGPECKGCAKVKTEGEGFCCGKGKVFDLDLTNKAVYELLAGTAGQIDKLKNSPCPSCKTAATDSGVCKHCKVYVANDRVYKSPPAYVLASGKLMGPEKSKGMGAKCAGCAQASSSGAGFCGHCNVGFVAHRAFKSKETYDKAVNAYETIEAAVKDAAHCEKCATARLTDGKCESCQVSFKYGKPVEG